MVQEYTSPGRVYEYPFEMVMAAYERRFPTCEMIPAFLGSDITDEYKSEDGAIHVVERRCRLHVDAPYLLRKIAGIDHAVFIQTNSLNRRDRTLKIEAFNETFENRLTIKECCLYSVHPENSEWTLFEQNAHLDITNFFGFEPAVEKVAIKAYTSNLKKGREIIMHFINELIAEGQTHFPVFEDSLGTHEKLVPSLSDQELQEGGLRKFVFDGVVDLDASGSSGGTQGKGKWYIGGSGLSSDDDVPVTPKDLLTPKGRSPEHPPLRSPPPLQEYKLDEKYIARYLGDLTPEEEAGLMWLGKRFQDMHRHKAPSESVLFRFLRAHEANVEKALEALLEALHWRKKYHVDNILDTWRPAANILEYYPGGWHQFDVDGRPVYVVRLGSMDVKGLLKTVGEDGFIKQIVSINEEGLRKCAEATDIYNRPITDWTLLVDLDELNMRHLWRPGIRALLRIIENVEVNYPETKGRLLIVRAPKVFGVVWTLLSPFIDDNTQKKFMIFTGDDHERDGGLLEYIPKEYIPKFLNGPAECAIPKGRTVPKSLHKFDHIEDATETTWLHTDLYQTAHIVKGEPLYVSCTVVEAEGVITWDFDVIEGDCVFQVLRHKRPRDASMLNISCLGEASNKFSIRPGIDAVVVEKPVTCNQGDSLQGMHICQQPGLYLLEWKYLNPVRTKQSSLKLHNKTKLMYYHKLLLSRDFMGSMSSISSAHSTMSSRNSGQLSSRNSVAGLSSRNSVTGSSGRRVSEDTDDQPGCSKSPKYPRL